MRVLGGLELGAFNFPSSIRAHLAVTENMRVNCSAGQCKDLAMELCSQHYQPEGD